MISVLSRSAVDREERRFDHLPRYVLVGGGSVVVDAVVYWLLATATGSPLLAKAVSYVAGAAFSYLGNWRYTFGRRRSALSEVAFVMVYVTSLGVNVAINQGLLAVLPETWWAAPLAFLASTSVTTVWNYLGQSLLVFTRKHPAEPGSADRVSEDHS